MFQFLTRQFSMSTILETSRDASVRPGRNRTHRASAARFQPGLEALEQRLCPTNYYGWVGGSGPNWSADDNWVVNGGFLGQAPYGDSSAFLIFEYGVDEHNPIHDFTSPTTIDSIEFQESSYSLSAASGASVITLTGDIINNPRFLANNTISLPLSFSTALHHVNVGGGDTLVLSGTGNLSGSGVIYKVGPGTLVMSGDHTTFQGQIDVGAGTLQVASDNGLGMNEPITVGQGGVLDLNNHNETLRIGISEGEIRLGNGNLTLPQGSQIRGDINGAGGLTLSGYTEMQGRQNYTGPTRLLSGELHVNGSSAESPITISSGATLHGRGTTGALSVRGLVQPGDGQLGRAVLRTSGDVTFLPASSFAADIHGLNPGDGGVNGYDQLNVNGRVDLSNSPTLHAVVTFNSHPGDSFTILTSTDGITGTFAGLPDGTNFGLNGTPMQIHYTGTSVVLTHRPQFLPPVTYSAGRSPTFVATGDFRGIGVKDLVTANYYDASVNVLLGNGDGTFQAAVRYATSPFPNSVTVGDFNGDGALDLVTTGSAAGEFFLSVLLGNGDGSFQAAVTYPLDRQVSVVAAADFNHDGSLDLVTTNPYESTVSMLLGNGDGSFQAAVTYPVGRGPNAVALADFNGDGALDLVTANSETVSVLLGNGDGSFQPAMDFPGIYGGLTSIAVGDFRGNGMLDLIVTANSAFASSVYVLLGNGDGTFARPASVFATDQPGNVAVGDFDGDGKLDFVVTTNYPSYRGIALLYGKGDGSFRPGSYYYVTPGLFSLAVDSFQGTRFPDLAVVNDAVVSVLLNVGDGGGSPEGSPSGGARRPSVEIGQFSENALSRIAGAGAALRASPSPAETPTRVLPSAPALPPVLAVASVERFFANATAQDPGSAWVQPRSKTGGDGQDLFYGNWALDTYDWDPATETLVSV